MYFSLNNFWEFLSLIYWIFSILILALEGHFCMLVVQLSSALFFNEIALI